MYSKRILIMVLVLALVSLACGITINQPLETIKVGPNQTMAINVPLLEAEKAQVKIEFGAGELIIEPGAANGLIEGTAIYNVDELQPTIQVNGNEVLLRTGKLEVRPFPWIEAQDIKNEWSLKLGEQPIDLTINAGAYQGSLELGGLALTSLEVNDGASEVNLSFSQPNKAQMDTFRYTTGASDIDLIYLANANFSRMIFRGGAGSYLLDFRGQLSRETQVTIEAGISQITLLVPENTPTRVISGGGLSNVDAEGNWQRSGNVYQLSGTGPELVINVTMGAGNLELRTAP